MLIYASVCQHNFVFFTCLILILIWFDPTFSACMHVQTLKFLSNRALYVYQYLTMSSMPDK